ncbi:NADH-quinone oxidoreductase subunit N [Planctomyces sp. SH-PL14]|uniref:NADH-quinone oxidoreductase subunit N n=1 Tax=Planctomyces sp. SH-PL14 TaxID=1632864 RepID=UPI00078CD653|nr:NADH-quinone oxidoreductase subunit N [Planctomyces sp. SH-PL14]AMV21725.1 NADH-quinone oxidoreductase subunit N [Planctomyces sp. SH-PL14]
MSVSTILQQFASQDLPRSLEIFAPELLLCATILLLLLGRLIGFDRKIPASWIALLGGMVAFTAAFTQFMYLKSGGEPTGVISDLAYVLRITEAGVGTPGPYFTGLLMHDHFGMFFRLGLLLFLVLVIALTALTGIPDNEDAPDFYTLLCGSMVGMLVAVSANHLLMAFLAVEMMSVPSYAMVGFLKGRRASSEASFKYVVYGAGAAGVMLYGISLLSGLLGTAAFPQFAERFDLLVGNQFSFTNANATLIALAMLMILVGFAFKLSVFPFHFWCPDAFEGAAAEVGGYLSVASKAASFGLLIRFALAFQGTSPALKEFLTFFGIALGVLACLSMTFGNLAAYTQTNVKRLLAYSTIAHAGYMLLGVSALLVIQGSSVPVGVDIPEQSARAVEGLTYYIVVYLFMNLVAFATVALLRNEIFSEKIEDYRGLISENGATKVLCICLLVSFFSLVGLPPFGGFFGKFLIFASAFKAGWIHWAMWVFVVIAGLNTVFSLFYYLGVLKAMFIRPAPEHRRPLKTPGIVGAYVALITIPILVLGASPLQDDLSKTAHYVAAKLFE